jgi:hypothetical protein
MQYIHLHFTDDAGHESVKLEVVGSQQLFLFVIYINLPSQQFLYNDLFQNKAIFWGHLLPNACGSKVSYSGTQTNINGYSCLIPLGGPVS